MNMTQLNWLLAYCDVMITLMHPMYAYVFVCIRFLYERLSTHKHFNHIPLVIPDAGKGKKQMPKMMTHNIQDLDFRIFWQFLSVGIEKIKIAPQET